MLMQQPNTSGGAEGGVDGHVFRRFFSDFGTCIEIGAGRPDWLSIGALFRTKGWDVLSVEPNPVFADMHRKCGHDVVQCACGAEDRNGVDFFVVDSGGVDYLDGQVTFESWSSLGIRGDYLEAQQHHGGTKTVAMKVDVRRLDTLLASLRPEWRAVDLVAVDVEGWELEVLSGLDFARFRPRVVIAENLFLCASYRRFMRRRGYALWKVACPNEIYVRRDLLGAWERLRSAAASAVVTTLSRARLKAAKMIRRLVRRSARPESRAA